MKNTVIISVVVLLLGCAYLLLSYQPVQMTVEPQTLPLSNTSCGSLAGIERETCYINLMENTRNESICEKVTLAEMKDLCYESYIMEVNPTVECPKINDTEKQISCYFTGGTYTANTSLCEKINESDLRRDGCLTGVAIPSWLHRRYSSSWNYSQEERTLLCDRVQDRDMRVYCRAAVSNNKSLCEKISDGFRNMRCNECVSGTSKCVRENNLTVDCYSDCRLVARAWQNTTRWW